MAKEVPALFRREIGNDPSDPAHRDEKRDGHASRITKFMMLNGVRFGPQTSEAFVSLWRQGLPGEVIVDT